MKNRIIGCILAAIVLLAVWHIFSVLLNKAFLPTPLESFNAFCSLLSSGEMSKQFAVSAMRIVVSIIIGLVLSIPLGIILGRSEKANTFIGPLVYLLYPIPKIVFLPVIIVLLGLGNAPKILLITIVIFFQIVVVTRDAARAVPENLAMSMRSLGVNRRQFTRYLILPYCFPDILTSLRVSIGTAIAVLFVAETFVSLDGLGYLILNGMETRQYPDMYAGVIGMAILGVLLYLIVDVLENVFCRWKKYY